MSKADENRIARVNIRGLKRIKEYYQYNIVTYEIISKLDKEIDNLIKEQQERLSK